MKVYGPNALRNVAVTGHGGSGKTSLVDALAYVSGSSRRHGRIKDGSTLTDTSPDEIERQHSITLGPAYAEWLDTKINLLDTPGYLEYLGEAVAALSVADAALVVLSSTAGVEVGTEKIWELCDHFHLPRMLVVAAMDKDNADFARVYEDVRTHLTPRVVPVEVPVGDGRGFHGIVNLFSGHCHEYKGTRGEYEVVPVPKELEAQVKQYSDQLHRGGGRDRRRVDRALPRRRGDPPRRVHGGDEARRGHRCRGAALLLQLRPHVRYAHAAQGDRRAVAVGGGGARCRRVAITTRLPLLGRVFKTVSEPHVGDVTYFRLYRGEMRNGDEVWNAEHGVDREDQPPRDPAGPRSRRGRAAHAGRHRVRRQAQGHAHRRHLLPSRRAGAAPADRLSRGGGDGGTGYQAGRRRQAGLGAASPARGGPILPLRVQLGAGPDADPRDGRASLRDHPRAHRATLWRVRRTDAAPHRVSRDLQGKG